MVSLWGVMSQTERILFLDRTMRNKGFVTAQEAATYYEVSTRQIKRDIEYLRDRFNAPIIYSKALPGYTYERPFKDLAFADQNLVLFYVIMQSLAKNQHYIPVISEEIMKTVVNEVPKDYLDVCSKITYELQQSEFVNPEYFMAVCDAIRDKLCLHITYLNVKNEKTERIIEPVRIINYGGTWYIVCFDKLHKELRTFNLSRIQSTQLTFEPIDLHTEGYPNNLFFSYDDEVASFLSGGFGIFKGKKQTKVSVGFFGAAGTIVQNQTWHPQQELIMPHSMEYDKLINKELIENEKNFKPSVILSFPAADFTEVLSKILSFGALAKPIEPVEIVDLWKCEIKKMKEFL